MKSRGLIFIAFLIGLWSCGPHVSTSSKKPNLSNYKTFAWAKPDVETKNPVYSGDIVDSEIKSAVNSELAAKGFVEDSNNPDFLIKYHTYTEKQIGTSGGYYYPYYGYYGGPGWGGYYGGWSGYYGMGGVWGPSTYNYTEGYLVIDFIDSRNQQTIWRGSTEGSLNNGNDLAKKIDKGVHAIMKKVPDENVFARR